MQTFDKVVRATARTIAEHSPTILTAMGVAGVFTTAGLAVKATPAAMRDVDKANAEIYKKQLHDGFAEGEQLRQLTKWEIVKLTWKRYIPAATMGLSTAGAIVGVNSIHSRRNAALASIYSLTDTALREYQEKAVDILGEKGEAKLRDALEEDRLAKNPVTNSEVVITGNGEMLCYETLTGRYFMSDIESLRQAQNDVNASIINHMYASQNDFYEAINLHQTEYGDELGWEIGNLIELEFTSKVADDGRLCLVVSHRNRPKPNYYKN